MRRLIAYLNPSPRGGGHLTRLVDEVANGIYQVAIAPATGMPIGRAAKVMDVASRTAVDDVPTADASMQADVALEASVSRIKHVLQCSQTSTRVDMALNIRNAEAERLAAELAKQTGETKTEAVTKALRDRLARVRRQRSRRRLADELEVIAEHCASLPVIDARSADEILGYDERGLPR